MRLLTFVRPGDGLAQRATALEDAGIDVLAVAESYGFDAVSTLGFLAACTSRVELMSAIVPIYSRTPTLTAMTAAGLDALSGGRFSLGIGASGPQVVEGWHGVRYDAPLARTREVVEICRKVWRRERLEHPGPRHPIPLPAEQGRGVGRPLKLLERPVREGIPVHLAALGDRNVELAAEIADGWLPYLFLPERSHLAWGVALRRGAAKRDPALGPLQITAGGPLAIGAEHVHLREQERAHIALYVGGMGPRGKNFYNDVARRYGFEEEAARIQDLYLDGRHDEAAAAVPQELLDGTSLVGDEGFVRDRLRAYAEAGATTIMVDPVGPNPLADLRRLKEITEQI